MRPPGRAAARRPRPSPIRSGLARPARPAPAKDRRARRGRRCCCRSSRSSWCCSASTVAAYVGQQRRHRRAAGQGGRPGAGRRRRSRPSRTAGATRPTSSSRPAQRLKFVKPGERSYTVLDAEPATGTTDPVPRAGRARRGAALVRARCGSPPASPTCPGPAGDRTCRPAARRAAPTSTPSPGSSAARPRGVAEVAHRCPCGEPDVVRTEPRLPDGTPFPTSFYATCPRLTGALSTLESQGVMREMSERLEARPRPARAVYRARTTTTSRAAPSSATCPRSRASPPAACRPGSSACTCSSPTRSPPGPGSTRSATRRSPMLDPWWAAAPLLGRRAGRVGAAAAGHDATDAGSAP